MKTQSINDLSKAIDALVQQHFTACLKAAHDSIQRAFNAGTVAPRHVQARQQPAREKHETRRSSAEIQSLRMRLHDAVCANHGESMAVLKAVVGATAAELDFPMSQLRKAGHVRSVRQRHTMRYFPMTHHGQKVA